MTASGGFYTEARDGIDGSFSSSDSLICSIKEEVSTLACYSFAMISKGADGVYLKSRLFLGERAA